MLKADVVILTAIPLEYEAVLKVEAGAWTGSHWEEQPGPNGLPVSFRTFRGKGGQPLRVALTVAGDMGPTASANALLPLIQETNPTCIAMAGVCAGRPNKTNLGDVIAAERLFFHDTGKILPNNTQHDLKTYNLRDDWKTALERFDFISRFRDEAWWKNRPLPIEWQENWVLMRLHEGVPAPSTLPEANRTCPNWKEVIEGLWKSRHLKKGSLQITKKGQARISRLSILHQNRLPNLSPSGELLPFKLHVAPIGSGNKVIEDTAYWGIVLSSMRKTLGLEMEAAVIGAAAHAQRDHKLDALVMKGVMDFANNGRDDHFKEFAARAAAECLIAFLRENLALAAVPDLDDLLVSGKSSTPSESLPPSALLSARYEVIPFREQGCEAVFAELDKWCDDVPPVMTRLLYAEGGVGKTRIAIEWIQRRRAIGWAAGFLAKHVPNDWFNRLCTLGQPVLIVLDYAESRSDLRELLSRALRYSLQDGARALRRIRILLLARNDGDWWQALRQSDTQLCAWIDSTSPRELPSLTSNLTERETLFHEAAEHFAKKLGKSYLRQTPSVGLTDQTFGRVLYLHMAALATVSDLPFDADTLMDAILDHEEQFWAIRAQHDDVMFSVQRSHARQIVAASTLRGGIPTFEVAVEVAKRVLSPSHSVDTRLLFLLHRVYERSGIDSEVFLPALEPDLLGEGIVRRVAAPALNEDRLPFDWIDRVFAPNESGPPVSTGLQVLGRVSATAPSTT